MLWIGVSIGIAGCRESAEITRYSIPKTASEERANAESVRLLAAMAPRAADVWFLKLTAADSAVQKASAPFREIARSFSLDAAGEPTWTLPAGWEELPGDAIRFKTLRTVQDGARLDVSVTKLPLPAGDLNDYLLANVNRWRGQIGLPALVAEQLRAELESLTASDGGPVFVCDYRGAAPP
ncbi:MAG: hypothetical protein FJ297_12370 [Planctomycetes bacterium]|nr:hypothetical protein [Planctomycetota bacterium]